MADWLEFHDSTLTSVEQKEASVELVLDAYIQRRERLNAGWRGTGWTQLVRVVMQDGTCQSGAPPLPAGISDGGLQIGTEAPSGVVRLPLHVSDALRIWLRLTTGDVVALSGSAVSVAALFCDTLHPGD